MKSSVHVTVITFFFAVFEWLSFLSWQTSWYRVIQGNSLLFNWQTVYLFFVGCGTRRSL